MSNERLEAHRYVYQTLLKAASSYFSEYGEMNFNAAAAGIYPVYTELVAYGFPEDQIKILGAAAIRDASTMTQEAYALSQGLVEISPEDFL